ncbi:MFS transporter [Nocardioides perillae]|uniref:MFS family permease n=1 Tax=Nocardioides perillae TaxID=1119534 RepID=A0A7Y9RS98_9ACTN|nr:MFS transporter [Nocardioides perillae]NYG55686.1 MFS family permease [Nocardioides perillae]
MSRGDGVEAAQPGGTGGGEQRAGLTTAYRRVLATPGALRFSATGLVARLPISMLGLGIVLLVQGASGSYGLAGSVAAAYTVANAVVAIVQGRLLDALGQGRVLAAASVAFGVSTVALVTAVEAGWPTWTAYATAACAGASLPQIGSAVRARWAHVLDQPADVQSAYALEAVVDEAVFILGPIVVTLLATTVSPAAGLGVAVVAGVGGGLAFAAQGATAPPVHARETGAPRGPRLPWRTFAPLVVVSAMLGVLFGAAEVTTVAFAEEQGSQAWAGLLLALWALGSLVSGVVTGALTWRRGPASRLRWGAALMALAMAPLALVGSVPVMGALLLVGGGTIAPTLIATVSLTEQVVPRRRLTEGLAVVHTGLVAGVAPGAALSGAVVDAAGASAAYLVSLGAGVLAALAAQALPRQADRLPDGVAGGGDAGAPGAPGSAATAAADSP